MIRLWLKLIIPLLVMLIIIWQIAIRIYAHNPDLTDAFDTSFRMFRPQVVLLSSLTLDQAIAQRARLTELWDMDLEIDVQPQPVTVDNLTSAVISNGDVVSWPVRVGSGATVTIRVMIYDQLPPVIYVPLTTPGKWVSIDPLHSSERDSAVRMWGAWSAHQDRIVIVMFAVFSLLLAVALGAYLMWRLRGIHRVLHGLRAGDLGIRVGARGKDYLDQIGRDCDAMATRVQQLIHQQNDLLRMLAHELRTPLARIDLGIHLAERESGANERLTAVRQEIVHLECLIQDLTRLIRVEHQIGSEGRQRIDLAELARQVIAVWAPRHPELTIASEGLGDAAILGHPSLLRIALGNLVGNACRHARTRVRIGGERGATGLRMWVDDDGAGVPEPDRQRVFIPFLTLGASSADGTRTGLGLAIVQRIMEASGGSAACEASPWGGARFALAWPVESVVG